MEDDEDVEYIWQDREIRFDSTIKDLQPRQGEVKIDSINSVEDTKGNNGERGSLTITNLRIMWVSHANPRTNLSIGYNTIVSTSIKTAASRLKGTVQAFYIVTKFDGNRFEFVFTNLVRSSPRLFTSIQAVYRSYETTKLYRDLKLRGAIIKDKQLILLPNEQICNTINGVWNLSNDQGNLGTLYITNVRLVWFANLAENFNVSMPYLQLKFVRIRDSKFGPALVIDTLPQSGSYTLGFRIDPAEKLHDVYQEVLSLFQIFSVNPIFGVEYKLEDKQPPPETVKAEQKTDDIEIINSGGGDNLAAYFALGGQNTNRSVVYSNEIGLAVEELPSEMSLSSLWNVF